MGIDILVGQASMASGVVDICLIPEVSFCLEGKQGLMAYLETVLEQRGHAVICMAEGAGQASNSTLQPQILSSQMRGALKGLF